MPGLPEGHFAITPGPLLAAADRFEIVVHGKGGHGGAGPHRAIDSVLIGSEIVSALQSIVARNVDPMKTAVVSACSFHAGSAFNIIPPTATLGGTVRTFDPGVRDLVERRISEVADGIARAYGGSAETKYTRMYPATVNHERETVIAAEVARDVVGADRVDDRTTPIMGGEDFAFMLLERPGAFIFLGMGDSPECHHPAYTFNDSILGHGASYWVRMIEKSMPAN
jgi:hippurate hydrolase